MQFDFQMNASGGQQIDTLGSYVKYKTGLGAIRVRVAGGGYVDLTPGQSIRLPKQFTSINVTDKSGNFNAGVLIVGDVDFQDDSIIGTVSIVDGGKNSTLSKNCFLATVDSGGVASNYNGAILINPSDSLKNVILESVIAMPSSGVIVSFHILGLNAALNVRGVNKCAAVGGGAASLAKVEGNFAAAMSTWFGACQKAYASTSVPMVRKFAEPLILPPGMAIAVVANAIGVNVMADFEWREDPV